ncbi:AAEL014516-PA [Aedes aegypti]|uniref:Metalloendopeptidase n=1 Tax=Aedes aegypti TaxID=7159 RepID=Q16G57_AEDAE|nr:AAEL014516-PA [Aedes aegypti]
MMNKFAICAVFVALCAFRIFALPVVPNASDAEQQSGNFEGDMILSKEQRQALAGMRNGLSDDQYRWPNNTVYYRIISDNFTTEQVNYIRRGLDTIAMCRAFDLWKQLNSTAYIRVLGNEGGCFSEVGYTGTVQDLNLAPNELENGCFRLGTIMHEFLHALGFYHMQSASDRDDFVTIVWEKIEQQHQHNFEKYNSSFVSAFNVEYDYGSVLHYPRVSFSIDGSATIIPKVAGVTIGQRKEMSTSDITKLNRMYHCE